jgi:Bacterial Ig-like domain (group 2)
MPKSLCVAVLVFLATCLLCVSTLAQQAPPSADTFVSSGTPDWNYGASPIEVIGPGTTTYLKFNLSGVPSAVTVNKATLRLYVDAVFAGGQFDVYNLPSTPTWSEKTLKYSTPPPALGTSATGGHPITVSSSSLNNFLLIDITSTVQGWLSNPSSNNGVALALVGSTGYFSFDSKESFLTAHQPELEIVLNGPAGAQGLQGAQGPQGSTGATGPTGPAGATGATGATGPIGVGLQGPSGTNGTNGTDGVGFKFRNAFDSTATYAVNDVVTFNGSTYVATAANQGPSNSNPDVNSAAWTLMAQQGATGPAGAAGATGPQGPRGVQGPAGPPGSSGLISFNNLNAMPCFISGTAGTIALSFATNGVATLTCNPSVAPTLTSIAITPANPSIAPGNTQQFTAKGNYSDGSTQDFTTAVTWSSSNTAAATIVANTGVATTVASGTTTISATLGSVSGMTTLQVLAPDGINNTAGNPHGLGTLACGQSVQISGTTFPAGTTDWLSITWSPDATCEANGIVMVPTLSASSSGIAFDVFKDAAGTGVVNAFNVGSNIVGITNGGPAASVRDPGTYLIHIYGISSSVTGTWTMSLTSQSLPNPPNP